MLFRGARFGDTTRQKGQILDKRRNERTEYFFAVPHVYGGKSGKH